MEKEGLASIFKMEDITVMGAAELFPHLFRIWVGILCNQHWLYVQTTICVQAFLI